MNDKTNSTVTETIHKLEALALLRLQAFDIVQKMYESTRSAFVFNQMFTNADEIVAWSLGQLEVIENAPVQEAPKTLSAPETKKPTNKSSKPKLVKTTNKRAASKGKAIKF